MSPSRCLAAVRVAAAARVAAGALLDQITGAAEAARAKGHKPGPDLPAWQRRRTTGCSPACKICLGRSAASAPLTSDPPTQREVLAYLHRRWSCTKARLAELHGVSARTIYTWLGGK